MPGFTISVGVCRCATCTSRLRRSCTNCYCRPAPTLGLSPDMIQLTYERHEDPLGGAHLMGCTPEAARRRRAAELGMSYPEYETRCMTEKWCTGCKRWHPH